VLVSRKGHKARILRRADYRRDIEFMGRFEPNPFYRHRGPTGSATPPGQDLGANVVAFPHRRPPPEPGCTL